jgi:hypothetical protein
MAKKNKNPDPESVDLPEIDEHGEAIGTEQTEDDARVAADVPALMSALRAAQADVDVTQDAADKAVLQQSYAIKNILDAMGSGPFQIDGRTVTITSRTKAGKTDPNTGEELVVYFFKRLGGEIRNLDG